ncbi:MAG: hypothetical protein JSR91_04330 [Proteobacteria bacterium]|nr:hypothetical protein [Pseudomonadota bacterium]
MSAPPSTPADSIDPLELYAAAIDSSDYVMHVAPVVRRLAPPIGALLDVGAGGGQLGAALRKPSCPWTAIEPSPAMRSRLAALPQPPRIVAQGWEQADVATAAHDTVLAATTPALFDSERFLARCRRWARRTVVWIVPAQAGPRGICFAGCLPREWHGEDETPGVDLVLDRLPASMRPDAFAFASWTFTGIVRDLTRLSAWLADRLGWAMSDARRAMLVRHLEAQAKAHSEGHRLDIPRKSAVLVWGRS